MLSCPLLILVTSCKVFPVFLVSFWICSSHPILGLPFPLIYSILSHTCLGFLLLSIPIRCPNHLTFFLSTILVIGLSFNFPLIWLFPILSLLVFPLHFLRYLTSTPVTLLLRLVNIVSFLSHIVVLGDKPFYKFSFWCYC